MLGVDRWGQAGPWSERTAEVCMRFGISPGGSAKRPAEGVVLPSAPGTVVAVCGPSGAGKTTLLEEMAQRIPGSRRVDRVVFPRRWAIVDGVARRRSLGEGIAILTACGMGEPHLWVRRFSALSKGEQVRARLARAISLHLDGPDPMAPLLCDEFGSGLHSRMARAIAYNLGKLARRRGLRIVVATPHAELTEDLRPNVVVRLGGAEGRSVVAEKARCGPPSFARGLRVEAGHKRDYAAFAAMHYRQRDELGFVDRVFVARDGIGGELLGIVVYAHGPLDLSLRNRATAGRFRGRPDLLNREMRIIRRLVVHPDVRGCGIGHWLVRQTLPLLEVPFVETLATMGTVNPVFEKAGMERVGVCRSSPGSDRLIGWLRRHGADPTRPGFEGQVMNRPDVRAVVVDVVRRWYRATTGAGRDRVAAQSPMQVARTFRQLVWSQPVYYLWRRDSA